jgi:hypothetical protein
MTGTAKAQKTMAPELPSPDRSVIEQHLAILREINAPAESIKVAEHVSVQLVEHAHIEIIEKE